MVSRVVPPVPPVVPRTCLLRAVLLVVCGLLVALVGVPSTPAVAGTVGRGQWPLQPRPAVVHPFDPPEHDWEPGHRGVDLAGAPGAVVRAALPGRVSYAAVLAGRPVVVVDHGTTRTTYEPVAASVPVGGEVVAGQALGTLVLVGSHCAPTACLHWGWRRGGTYLDPLDLVGARPVRLVPLSGLGGSAGAARPVGPVPPGPVPPDRVLRDAVVRSALDWWRVWWSR